MSDTKLGIAFLASAPMRLTPSDRAEMVNVLLFGETFDVLEEQPKWVYIKLHHDGYEGWIDRLQYQGISPSYFEKISTESRAVCCETIQLLKATDASQSTLIPQGSYLPLLADKKVCLEHQDFEFEGEHTTGKNSRKALIDIAFSYLNSPYLWGGRTPMGIDCSGFTQMVYRQYGKNIPRDASQQAKKGMTLSFLEECEPGDLAFFDNAEGNIVHVGIVIEEGKIIHASGKVRVDGLDHSGIYNAELGRHTHKLRVLKRLI